MITARPRGVGGPMLNAGTGVVSAAFFQGCAISISPIVRVTLRVLSFPRPRVVAAARGRFRYSVFCVTTSPLFTRPALRRSYAARALTKPVDGPGKTSAHKDQQAPPPDEHRDGNGGPHEPIHK